MTDETIPLLVVSSSFFAIPAIYALQRGHIVLSLASFISGIVSAIYWLNPMEETIHTFDLITSRVSFLVYFYYGFRGIYINYKNSHSNTSTNTDTQTETKDDNVNKNILYDIIIGYIVSSSLIYSYRTSCFLSYMDNPNWLWYHFMFHLQTIYLKIKAIQYA